MANRCLKILAALAASILSVCCRSSADLVFYTDRSNWVAAVEALDLMVEKESFDGDHSVYAGRDQGVARGPGGPSLAADQWILNQGDYIATSNLVITAESGSGWRTLTSGAVAPCSGNHWDQYWGKWMKVQALSGQGSVTNCAAFGLDVSHSYYNITGGVRVDTTVYGTRSWAIPENTYSFAGWVDTGGIRAIKNLDFGGGYYDHHAGDNFSFAYRPRPRPPLLGTVLLIR